ncbi:MAG: hypothetical protein ABFQ64_00485 [Campylobacterota bacterium]
MRFVFKLKHHFFNAFREIFVHHHGSLEFRAKIFALVISANENTEDESYTVVKNTALDIYDNDDERANLLVITTKELVKKVKDNNGLDLDTLILSIQKELKIVPRYAKKIDIDSLQPIVALSHDSDTISYQENILEFLQNLKDETLSSKKSQIVEDEEKLLQESSTK